MTPLDLVRQWTKRLPGCYDQLDELKKADVFWPDYCVLPLNAAVAYLADKGIPPDKASDLTACWLWRQNKVIYRFDEDLTDTLAAQAEHMEDTEVLPAELLLHPPYPAVYIKAPNLIEGRDGFFYFMDYDVEAKRTELRLLWISGDDTIPQVMHIVPGGTIRECVEDTLKTIMENFENIFKANALEANALEVKDSTLKEAIKGVMKTEMLKAITLLLYLVSQNADITDDQPYRKKRRPYIADTKQEIHTYSVGLRIGAVIRKVAHGSAEGTGLGSRKRPHSRRGHWHRYWTGPKEDQKLVLKWLAPMYINADYAEFNEDDVVVYPVKAPK